MNWGNEIMDFFDVDDFVKLFPDEKTTLQKLMMLRVLKETRKCDRCSNEMKLKERKSTLVFRCRRNACGRRDVSVRKGSVFENSKLGCREILKIARAFLQGEGRAAAARSSKVSERVVTMWFSAFRELLASSLREKHQKIGGDDIVVQIDETKLGRRKFHRGHRVEGVWVVCGVEMTDEGRAFCVPVETRDAETLQRIIGENVKENSTVWTDGWKGYNHIDSACNVRHEVVNHSLYFKDPVTGVCTNGVEGLNCGLKSSIIPQHRTEKFAVGSIAVYLWKRKNKNRLCSAFLEVLRESLIVPE
jgi:transposase-like protein